MKPKTRGTNIILLACLISFPLTIFGFLKGYIHNPASFKFKQREEWKSPDGKEKIISYTRMTYPRTEILDPSGIVRLERINEYQRVDISYEFHLHEIDNYYDMRIEWIEGIPTLFTPEYGWPDGTNQLPLKTIQSEPASTGQPM